MAGKGASVPRMTSVPDTSVAALRFQVTYSRMIARELQLDEAGLAALLAGTSLSPAQLFQLEQQVSAPDQYAIIHNALGLSGNPAFGLQLGSRLQVSAHGALGAVMAAAPDLRTSFAAVERFHNLRAQFLRLNHHEDATHFAVGIELLVPLDAVGLFLIEAMVASTQSNVEFMLGRAVPEVDIELGYAAPAHAARYAEYLHGRHAFGHAATRLRIPKALLTVPNPFRDDAAYAEALLQCERLEAAQRPREAWAERVASLLRQHPGQLWTQAEVAAALNVSARTLVRHLQAEGSRYQRVQDGELCRQAQRHLEAPRHTVASVAAALGYQDTASFRRAFKRWTGQTPQDWQAARRARLGLA